jgi:hypothetical protein
MSRRKVELLVLKVSSEEKKLSSEEKKLSSEETSHF